MNLCKHTFSKITKIQNCHFFPFYRLPEVAIREAKTNVIWHPKITFLRLLSLEKFPGIGYETIKYFYYRDNGNSDKIHMFENFKLKFSCDFDFQTYPFDEHECDVAFVDWRFEHKEMLFNATKYIKYRDQYLTFGNKGSLKISAKATPFAINITINEATAINSPGGMSSIAGIKLNMKRKSIDLLFGSYYVPTGMFAVLSMSSFVINPDVVRYFIHFP